jgi:hypothetical protein
MAAGSLSIAFGNFRAGYVIAERNATTNYTLALESSGEVVPL